MKNNRYYLLALMAGLVIAITPAAGQQEIPLWPHGAPGSEGKTSPEKVRVYAETGDHVIWNVHNPSITPYLPAPGKATGAAIVICPGGGHRELWIDHEGHNPARWLSERGIAVFILKYRLAKDTASICKTIVACSGGRALVSPGTSPASRMS